MRTHDFAFARGQGEQDVSVSLLPMIPRIIRQCLVHFPGSLSSVGLELRWTLIPLHFFSDPRRPSREIKSRAETVWLNGPRFFSPDSRGFYTMHVRFGGFAPGLLESREHPRASQADYRRMITQNRCSAVKYSEDSLASIRPSPLRCQPPHACTVCQPSPNRFGFGYSPATTLQGRERQFACRRTRSTLRCQSSRHSCPLYSDVLDNRHKVLLL